ncbi:MAG: L-carnitine ABC transporter, substrate-binding protein CaiX [uncultured Paraburkholderia sp.]|nr:MAG: L-carnitine ABC transporter, substrate-binding protein CaiX [uncultured Paraburkholderia sp.]CAH2931895.1 MAG: L-carnitine ABC transporter, substrate-binding protein CaiX [uncultured Paraburkholderia sp.]
MKLRIKTLLAQLARLACLAAACGAALTALPAFAQDPPACRAVHFADIDWTDITSTTALASTVFEGLGYQPVTTVASVPISFAGLKSKQLDISLGYWWPVQEKAIAPFVESKSIEVLQPPNLTGSEGVFGPNDGEAHVYTLTSPDYLSRCPNAGKLVSNLRFSTQLENVVMQSVMNKEKSADAARAYLKKNPQVLDAWLAGVKTYDGKDGLPAVKAYLGL